MQRFGLTIQLCIAVSLWAFLAQAAPVETVELPGYMHEHFDAVTNIRAAIERGDLESLREPARWLLAHPAPTGTRDGWDSYLKAMNASAQAALDAKTFMAAATATSRMAVACGECHVANNVSEQFRRANEPGEEFDKPAHMQRHQWAADRMWEGLIGPSEDAWNLGANLLFEAPLSTKSLDGAREITNIRRMARRIHQLAANATMQFEAPAQAEVYAEFLATCASCHAIMEQGPGQ